MLRSGAADRGCRAQPHSRSSVPPSRLLPAGSSSSSPPAQCSIGTRLSLSNARAGERRPRASGKAQPRLPSPSHSSLCLRLDAWSGGTVHTFTRCTPPQPHISPLWRWPWDARARCNSARWPVPVCSQTPAPQGLIHHSGPINKTWARPADASPPRGCAAIIYFLIGVEEGFAVVFMALRHGTYGVRVQGVPGRLIFFL